MMTENDGPQAGIETAGEPPDVEQTAELAEAIETGAEALTDPTEEGEVQGVEFAEIGAGAGAASDDDIAFLLDVSLLVTVQLGSTRKSIREILSWGPGSVIELEKLAGEPVDILVNETRIATGEVVVVDESFGVRITDVLSPRSRLEEIG